jgi:hypothetical protein
MAAVRPEDAIAAAEKTLQQALPPGWQKRFVEPPWRDAKPGFCRGCGKDSQLARVAEPGLKWSASIITKQDQRRKLVWYSFALVCERCGQNRPTMDKLALQCFAPQSPEAGTPPIEIITSDPSKPEPDPENGSPTRH